MQLSTIMAQIGAWSSIIVLLITIIFILSLRGWKYTFIKYLFINTIFCTLSGILAYALPQDNLYNQFFQNLTVAIDIITTCMIFYSFWENETFKGFLKISTIPILLIWLIVLVVYGFEKVHIINLLVPAAWTIVVAGAAFLLVFIRNSEKNDLGTKFLISAGFIFYAFNYFIIKVLYILLKSGDAANDLWSLNVWSWLISRSLLLVGTLYFLYNKRTNYKLKSVLTW